MRKNNYWGGRRPLNRVNSLLTVMGDCRVILSFVQSVQRPEYIAKSENIRKVFNTNSSPK